MNLLVYKMSGHREKQAEIDVYKLLDLSNKQLLIED